MIPIIIAIFLCFLLWISPILVVDSYATSRSRNIVDFRCDKSERFSLPKLHTIAKQRHVAQENIARIPFRFASSSLRLAARDNIYTRRVGSKGGGQPSDIRSKRQERLGQLISSELGRMIHSGLIKGRDVEYISDDLRQRISVVKSDVSPDIHQARVYVSIRAAPSLTKMNPISNNAVDGNTNILKTTDDDDVKNGSPMSTSSSAAIDKRQAYSWLVRNTKQIRHTLAQKMSHMKICPTITFVQVNVAAAVDVMYLIDQAISGGQKRQDLPFHRSSSEEINWDEFEDDDDDDDNDDDDNDDDDNDDDDNDDGDNDDDDNDDEGEWDIIDKDFFKSNAR